jgi:glycosyltransferase involved in cell wall biosynthesis
MGPKVLELRGKENSYKVSPVISVVMAAYNEELFIAGAIQSIIDQTFPDWELIIVDDGSCDGTVDVVGSFAKHDARITLLRNESNMGLPGSLNKGIKAARGDYIARADADDINLPKRFEKQYLFMQANPKIHVLGTGAFLLDEHGRRSKPIRLPETHEQLRSLNFLKSIFFHPSVMIRKSFFERAGFYDTSYIRTEDKELWLRGLRSGCVYANLAESLIEYRTNGYVRSWRSIIDSTRTSFKMVRKYEIRNGYVFTILLFLLSLSAKYHIRRSRSLR